MKATNYVKIVVISFLTMLTGAYVMTFPLSFLPQLTLWLGYEEKDKGYFVGIMFSAFFFGCFLSHYQLGVWSDTLGHRRVLTTMLIANTILNASLGFCQDIYTVVVIRFLSGVCNVILPLSRAILPAFCDDGNKARAMAVNQMGLMFGITTGSAIGGYFVYFPARRLGLGFPYLVPTMAAAGLSAVTAIVTYRWYPKDIEDEETRNIHNEFMGIHGNLVEMKTYNTFNDNGNCNGGFTIQTSDQIPSRSVGHIYTHYDSNNKNMVREYFKTKPITHTHDNYHNSQQHSQISGRIIPVPNNEPSIYQTLISKLKRSTFIKLLSNANVVKASICYSLVAAVMGAYTILFSVWASTIVPLGGLAYTTHDIGLVVAIVVNPASILQFVLFPKAERRWGSVPVYISMSILLLFAITLTPLTRFIQNTLHQWICLLVLQFASRFAESVGTSAIVILLNNSVSCDQSGAVNGLSSMVNTLALGVIGLVGGSIYAASITSSIDSPVDTSLVFTYLGVHCIVAAFVAYTLPRELQ